LLSVTLRALALLFKSTHVPPGDTLIHQGSKISYQLKGNIYFFILPSGDVLYSIYFIREGQMEILQNNELQAILGRNDILGENPCNTIAPGKSRCAVRGIFY
jgi:CRP-like cAMP-binding protein